MGREGILFLGQHNAVRSQIAEGFARALAPRWIEIYSAGSEPTALHPCVVQVMADVGIDVSDQYAKPITAIPIGRLATVVSVSRDAVWADRPPVLLHHPCSFDDPMARCRTQLELFRACCEIRDQLGSILREYFARRGSSMGRRIRPNGYLLHLARSA